MKKKNVFSYFYTFSFFTVLYICPFCRGVCKLFTIFHVFHFSPFNKWSTAAAGYRGIFLYFIFNQVSPNHHLPAIPRRIQFITVSVSPSVVGWTLSLVFFLLLWTQTVFFAFFLFFPCLVASFFFFLLFQVSLFFIFIFITFYHHWGPSTCVHTFLKQTFCSKC